MDISNKTLAMFLVAAIVVSVAGTIVSLNKLDSVSYTGFATSMTGNVSVTVASQLSITTADSDTINFGSCTPQSGADSVINSEDTQDTPSVCTGFSATNISVRNDGNVNANVTINASDRGEAHGGTFINGASDNSWVAYKTVNQSGHGSYAGGCMSSVQSSYTNITATYNTWMKACENLAYGPTYNSIDTHVQIMIPSDAVVGSDQLVLTFYAQNA